MKYSILINLLIYLISKILIECIKYDALIMQHYKNHKILPLLNNYHLLD